MDKKKETERVMSTESALSAVRQALNGYKGFKKLEEVFTTAVIVESEMAAAKNRRAVAIKEAEALQAELEDFRKTVDEEKANIRSKHTDELLQFKVARSKAIDELEAGFSARIAPLQAEEVRAGKAVENLQKELGVLTQECKKEQDKLDAIKAEFTRIKATFS